MTTVGSLCSGYLGLDLGLELGDTDLRWTVENDPNAKIIAARAPGVPNYGDITTVDWAAVEPVEWMTMGFPCTDLSHAGKRAGLRPDTRSGIWFHCAYAIGQIRPRYVLIENVRGLLSGKAARDMESDDDELGEPAADAGSAFGVVLGDLADLGYDARWVSLRASDVEACHGRFRVFIFAADTRGEAERRGPGLCEGEPRGLWRRRPYDDGREASAADAEPVPHGQRGDAGGVAGAPR